VHRDESAPHPADDPQAGPAPTSSPQLTEGATEAVGPPPTPDPSLPATEIHGPIPSLPDGRLPRVPGYEVLTLLGAGSFGRVYKAREAQTGKVVAIKFFTHGAGARWQALLEEVRQHARFDAVRGIIDLKQVVAAADPPYYVMAFADGGSLADRLARQPRLPAEEAVGLFRQAAEALAYVHAKGICHCDLKPGNVLLDARGHVLLADFGQAQPTSDGSPALGTLFYMPPEQAAVGNTLPDPSWDVYALGAVLYVMLTGERPRFDAAMQDEMARLPDVATRLARYREWLRAAPAPSAHHRVPGVDADLARILDRCLSLDAGRRFPDAGALLAALSQRDRTRRRRPLLLFGLAASLFTLFITAFTESRANNEAVDTYERDLTSQLLDSNRSSASLIAGAFENQLRSRLQRVSDGVTPELVEATRDNDRPTLEHLLEQLMLTGEGRVSQRFAETTVTNARGELLAMVRLGKRDEEGRARAALVPMDPKTLRSPYRHVSWRDWFSGKGDRYDQTDRHHPPIEALHVSDPYASALDPDGLFISISAPIRDEGGKVIGVLEAAILMAEMGRWLREAHIARDGAVVVLDRRGHCVLHTARPYRPRLGQPARRLMTADELAERFPVAMGTVARFFDPLESDEQLAGYARMADERIGWVVLVEHGRGRVLAPIHALRDRPGWIGWQSYVVIVVLVGGLWGGLFWTLRRAER
jgi:serine/threonine protein kinase